eukprot:RCo012201
MQHNMKASVGVPVRCAPSKTLSERGAVKVSKRRVLHRTMLGANNRSPTHLEATTAADSSAATIMSASSRSVGEQKNEATEFWQRMRPTGLGRQSSPEKQVSTQTLSATTTSAVLKSVPRRVHAESGEASFPPALGASSTSLAGTSLGAARPVAPVLP